MERLYFQTGVGNMSYLRRNGKSHVVFIHGFTASAYIWRRLAARMSPEFDIVCVDLFGHGRSDIPILDSNNIDIPSLIRLQSTAIFELIENLGFEKYAVVGSSLGGWIAMDLAVNLKRPEKAVLVDTAGTTTINDGKFADGMLELLAGYMKRKRRFGKMLASAIITTRPEQLKMDPSLMSKVDFDVSIIWGENDHILNPKYGKELSKTFKDSEFHMIKNADHTPFTTHPSEVADIINSFLSTNE